MYAERRLTTRRRLKQPDPRMLDDDLMVEHAREDEEAFAPIYERYSTPVYRMCLRAVGNAGLADEFTAKTFLTVIEKLHWYRSRSGSTFRRRPSVLSRNMVHDHRRRNNRLVPLASKPWEPEDDGPAPDEIAASWSFGSLAFPHPKSPMRWGNHPSTKIRSTLHLWRDPQSLQRRQEYLIWMPENSVWWQHRMAPGG